jgi:chemotaxis response regulator CheB
MLSESGIEIDVAENGAEAIRAAGGHTYDAVLMDCQMPEVNGFEPRPLSVPASLTPIEGLLSSPSRRERDLKTVSAAWQWGWTNVSPNRYARMCCSPWWVDS